MDLLSEHSEPFSATWPSSGTTRSGVAFELPTPALPTAGTGSSSLPTPRASRGASGTETMYALGAERSDASRPQGEVVMLPTPAAADSTGGRHNRPRPGGEGGTLPGTVIELLPTPTTMGGGGKTRSGDRGGELLLPGVVETLLPTPAVVMNDGEQPETWLARRERVKAKGINGNGMGMPLPIALLLLESGDRSHLPSGGGSGSPDE